MDEFFNDSSSSNSSFFNNGSHYHNGTNITLAPTFALTTNNTVSTVSTALSPWLLSMAIIFPVLIVLFSFALLVNMQHPDDRNVAICPKVIVVTGLTLAQIAVMMFPLDVANRSGVAGCGVWTSCGGLNLADTWQAIYIIIIIYVVILIPFSIFLYEAYTPGGERNFFTQLCEALQWQIAVLIIVVIAFAIMFTKLNVAEIPITTYDITNASFAFCPMTSVNGSPIVDPTLQASACLPNNLISVLHNHSYDESAWYDVVDSYGDVLKVTTSFVIFLICFMSFVGWFAFSFFLGVGFVALPIDLVRDFRYRPQYMPKRAYLYVREDIQKRVTDSISILTTIKSERKTSYSKSFLQKRRLNTKTRSAIKKIKAELITLEAEYEELVLCHEQWKNYNPLIPIAEMFFGIISGILSLLWILQIILYILWRPNGYPISYFLNDALSYGMKEINFAFLGVGLLAIFAFYLLLCVIKGNFKIGVRFFIFEVHPMKYGGTYMNSFLVNTSIILLCSPAVVMFCSQAFANFVVLTDIQVITIQVTFMQFFKWFFHYNVFIYVIVIITFISGIYFFFSPNDKQALAAKKLKASIAKFEKMEDVRTVENLETRKRENHSKSLDKGDPPVLKKAPLEISLV